MKEIHPTRCPYRLELSWDGDLHGNLQIEHIFTSDSKPVNEWTESVAVSTEGHYLAEKPDDSTVSCDITIFPEQGHRLLAFSAVCDARRLEVKNILFSRIPHLGICHSVLQT